MQRAVGHEVSHSRARPEGLSVDQEKRAVATFEIGIGARVGVRQSGSRCHCSSQPVEEEGNFASLIEL
jgi:hypothetical protein